MTEEEIKDYHKKQLEDAELRLKTSSVCDSVFKLTHLVQELLSVVILEKQQQSEFKQEHDLMLRAILHMNRESEALRQVFTFRTPEKLEQALIKRCEQLSLEEHARVIQKVRSGDFSELPTKINKKRKTK